MQNEIYPQLFTQIRDIVLIVGPHLEIIYANPSAERFFQTSLARAHLHSLKDLLAQHSWEKIQGAVKRCASESRQILLRLSLPDSHQSQAQYEISVSAVLRQDQKSGEFLISLRDSTQDQQVAQIIQESQKMEAAQYFANGAIRELKMPLLVALKRLENMQNKYQRKGFEYLSYKDFNQIMVEITKVREQIDECFKTASRLTDLSKKRLKYESKDTQVNSVIQEIVRQRQGQLQAGRIKLRMHLLKDLPTVSVGEIEMTQIVDQIVDNAIQAMPAGGVLGISARWQAENDQVLIDIVDTGVGIHPDDLPHIFDPFFSSHHRRSEKKSSLGLPIVHALVKAGRGEIKVKSSLRKGTTVQICFPANHSRKNIKK